MSAPFNSHSDDDSANIATVSPDRVRSEFLHAWNGYKQYAWGHDALNYRPRPTQIGIQTPCS